MSFPNLRMPLVVALGCMLAVPVLHAADSDATAGTEDIVLPTVVVTAQLLNEERAAIETQTGASTYTIDDAAIAATPGGANVLLNQVLLQAPDVAQDSFGQIHVRGDHNDLQYRLNGIILPEGISVFSQTLEPAADLIAEPDHRRAAGRVRPAHRRHHRPDHQERPAAARRIGLGLRRQPRHLRAERRLRRQLRQSQLLRHGRHAAQ